MIHGLPSLSGLGARIWPVLPAALKPRAVAMPHAQIRLLLSPVEAGSATVGETLADHVRAHLPAFEKSALDNRFQDLCDIHAARRDDIVPYLLHSFLQGLKQKPARPLTSSFASQHGSRVAHAGRYLGWFLRGLPASDAPVITQALSDAGYTLARIANARSVTESAALKMAEGLLVAGLVIDNRAEWIDRALAMTDAIISRQVHSDGGHVSRSPRRTFDFFKILVCMRHDMVHAHYPVPECVQHAIDRMGPAIRFFRHPDRRFALFQSSVEESEDVIDHYLNLSGSKGRALKRLPETGYERLAQGKTSIIIDTGAVPRITDGPDQYHASPLAFEMSYGSHRMIVNCGTHRRDKNWADLLCATAAHSGLTIDQENAIDKTAARQRFVTVQSDRDDVDSAILFDAAHDGYASRSGISHRRRLYLGRDGADLRGEDTLSCSIGLTRAHRVTLRFHLHPKVVVSPIQNGREALLVVGSRIGWRFVHQGGNLSIDESIYVGDGIMPQRTKQMVIDMPMTSDSLQIKWALQKEGDIS